MPKCRVRSRNFVILCSACGYIMPLENMKIVPSSNQSGRPCIEIRCNSCGNEDYLLSEYYLF